jgi:serine/threonine-protein kinase RsbW
LTLDPVSATTDLLGATEHSVNESYAACADTVPIARTRIGEFATRSGVTGAVLHSIRLAVSEAVTNVVRHAYRSGAGKVHVTAARLAGEFVVLVADDGCGHQTPAETPGFGWGLALIADAADDFVLTERGDGGTEVRMRFVIPEAAGRPDQLRGSVDSATAPA